MTDCLNPLVAALREELQGYGEMLALLERQQHFIVSRAAQEVFQSISVIQAHSEALQRARALREERRRLAAEQLHLPTETTFAALIPRVEADYQPLLQALVDENNQLLVRVRQRARQNHLLLQRSVELMQSVLNALMPPRAPATYNGHGDLAARRQDSRQLCNALG